MLLSLAPLREGERVRLHRQLGAPGWSAPHHTALALGLLSLKGSTCQPAKSVRVHASVPSFPFQFVGEEEQDDICLFLWSRGCAGYNFSSLGSSSGSPLRVAPLARGQGGAPSRASEREDKPLSLQKGFQSDITFP